LYLKFQNQLCATAHGGALAVGCIIAILKKKKFRKENAVIQVAHPFMKKRIKSAARHLVRGKVCVPRTPEEAHDGYAAQMAS
jgi:hypothetical protein